MVSSWRLAYKVAAIQPRARTGLTALSTVRSGCKLLRCGPCGSENHQGPMRISDPRSETESETLGTVVPGSGGMLQGNRGLWQTALLGTFQNLVPAEWKITTPTTTSDGSKGDASELRTAPEAVICIL
ncbi:Cna B domain-containing protein [Anopheles sinensis]|uniref:Cna B domain-containing protein n=1 Tax=Anopheles sinensis TaxID=74873 RepID=A0A084WMC2_ANOSI|nr:Cna B domain-containing protein [Anopheles sinensis]